MKTNLEEIQAKHDRGEELTPEEKKEVMSVIPPGAVPAVESLTAENSTDGKSSEPAKKTGEAKPDGEDTPNKKETPAKPEPGAGVDMDKILQDLELPEDQVDTTAYSEREKGLLRELRKERKGRQEAQRKLDESELVKLQENLKKKQEAGNEELEKIEKEIEAILEGMDDDDFLTVGQTKKMRTLQQKKAALLEQRSVSTKEEGAGTETKVELENYALKAYLSDKDSETFTLASENIETLLGEDREAQKQIAEARKNGENPVALAIQLVRKHPKWNEIVEGAKKKATPAKKPTPAEGKENMDRITKNEAKPKTTGAGGGGTDAADEYTLEELANMSAEDFGRLPASKRRKLLEQHGSHPNQV